MTERTYWGHKGKNVLSVLPQDSLSLQARFITVEGLVMFLALSDGAVDPDLRNLAIYLVCSLLEIMSITKKIRSKQNYPLTSFQAFLVVKNMRLFATFLS